MSVYVLTDGAYSDYHICGVYSTMGKAERAKLMRETGQGSTEDIQIEEWPMDAEDVVPVGMMPWQVNMWADGNSSGAYRLSIENFKEGWEPLWTNDREVAFRMFARDEQHAVKIANERRAALIHSGNWTTDWNEWAKLWGGK